ncbi:transcriptional activator TipA [Streptomyces sp. e14]|nr:transcriptional activator TipA [Streptomyces sp. e14]
MDELLRGAGLGVRRGDGAHPAPLRQGGAALPQRAQPRRVPALQRGRPGPPPADPLLPRTRLPPRRASRAILADPQANAVDHLRARQKRLSEEIARLQRLAEVAQRAVEVQQTGVTLTPRERFEVFGEIAFDLSYATEAELKWADSRGQREAMARAAAHTKEDWRQLMREAGAWRAELLAAYDEGEPGDGQRAMDLAEEHRLHISRWFTSCPPDMHRRIADDFVADPRAFALVVPPSQQRPGLAGWVCKAVHANAARRTDGRTDSEEDR